MKQSDTEHFRLTSGDTMLKKHLDSFIADESGATALEYSLIAAAISIVIVATLITIGQDVNAKFESVEAAFTD